MGIFEVQGRRKTVLGSTYVVERLLFFMFPLVMTFDFDLILWLLLTFLASNGPFFSRCRVQKLF